jgi:ABC-type polysaccharide/polyol phosphate transport system ATPase subunit
MSVVEFTAVSKTYPILGSPGRRLATLLAPKLVSSNRFTALQNLNFDVRRGETFCIIGRNGAGKSTLLQLVAGITQPTSGSVSVTGRVSALLELGSGFHPDFTGRQNVFLSASILGFGTRETNLLYPRVSEFAAIGDFIDRPIRTYSSGMLVRLAFALAIHVEPEILIVDEALSVGDQAFRQRCLRKVQELRTRGVSILFVSHAIGDVKSLGDRALWLDHGSQRELGPAEKVASAYLASLQPTAHSQSSQLGNGTLDEATIRSEAQWIENLPAGDGRIGDGRARICGFTLLDQFGLQATHLAPAQPYVARISLQAQDALPQPEVGLLIRNHLGIAFCGVTTRHALRSIRPLASGERCTVDLAFNLPEFYPGFFSFSPSVCSPPANALREQGGKALTCDWVDNALTLQMERSAGDVYGCLHVPAHVRWSAPPSYQEPRHA